MAFTHDHINAFVIVGGDSDFMTLVEKLKQYDKKVFVVGGRQFTSLVMQRNCHEFIAYENLVGTRRASGGPGRTRTGGTTAAVDVDKALPLVKRALKVLSDREVTPQLGLLKSTLLQLDSTFSERDYGANTFRDFIEKVAERGLVSLKQAGRSVLVELSDSALDSTIHDQPAVEPRAAHVDVVDGAVVPALEPSESSAIDQRAADGDQPRTAATSAQQAEAVHIAARLFASARQTPRWPMYIRQIRQFLRNADESFDERKLGFTGIVEFLRACQREGLLRLERDRQGVMRVFAGPSFGRPAEQSAGDAEPSVAAALELPQDESPELQIVEGGPIVEIPVVAEMTGSEPQEAPSGVHPAADVPVMEDVDEDLSVGPGNVATPGERSAVPRRARSSGPRAPRKPAAPRTPRAPRARKTTTKA
jgi:hypothetical protein